MNNDDIVEDETVEYVARNFIVQNLREEKIRLLTYKVVLMSNMKTLDDSSLEMSAYKSVLRAIDTARELIEFAATGTETINDSLQRNKK